MLLIATLNCSCCTILFSLFSHQLRRLVDGGCGKCIYLNQKHFWSIKLTRNIQLIEVNLQHTQNEAANLSAAPAIASSAAERIRFPSNFDKVIIQDTRQSLQQTIRLFDFRPLHVKTQLFCDLLTWYSYQPGFTPALYAPARFISTCRSALGVQCSKARSMWFWLGRETGRQRGKRKESGLCKCSLKSTCWSTLSPMILTYRTINSVK